MLLSWPLIGLLSISIPLLVVGVLLLDFGLQAVQVTKSDVDLSGGPKLKVPRRAI
jgi:hypothetical protein